jgi:anti-sigma factor RsiW
MGANNAPSDADLTAYLDGEMAGEEREALAAHISRDAELRDRLALLARGERPFRQAFDALLDQAPSSRLDAILAALPESSPLARRRAWGGRAPRIAAAAAGILLFLAGMAADRLVPFGQPEETEEAENWRQAVAEYLMLYSADTLATVPDDPIYRAAELESVGERLGLDLSPERVALPGLALKRAQLYRLDDLPLAQISYLDPESGPVAFCILPALEAGQALEAERRQGQNIVYWSQGDHTFMLVGTMAAPKLRALAETLAGQLAA